jgi:hypothetical protein
LTLTWFQQAFALSNGFNFMRRYASDGAHHAPRATLSAAIKNQQAGTSIHVLF